MENNFLILNFAQAKQPQYREKKGVGYIEYGEKNDYPQYLLELFNHSAKHQSLIKGKVNYIVGNGWKAKDVAGEIFVKHANQVETLDEVTKKLALDIELFGGAYVEVIWSRIGSISDIYHVDYTKIRSNKDNTQFWFKDNWLDRKEEAKVFNSFNPQFRSGSQILYIKEYRAGIDTYALPSYFGGLNYIESDIEVSKHILGNAQTGFSPSKLITLPNGEPSPEEKRKIERKFEDRFTGSDGKKFILSFVADSLRKPIIEDLGASDLTKEDFANVDALIQNNIFASHQITSPSLFGINEPGKLGSRTEMRDAYEIFKNTYVNYKQRQLEAVINLIGSYKNVVEPMEIQSVYPIDIEIDSATIASVLSKNEIRQRIGEAPLEETTSTTSRDIIEAINSLSPLVANKVLDSMTANEIRELVGLKATEQGVNILPSNPVQMSEDEMISIFNEFGDTKEEYLVLKSKERFNELSDFETFASLQQDKNNILSIISKDKLVTSDIIAKALKISVEQVDVIIEDLVNEGSLKRSAKNGSTIHELTAPLKELTDPNKKINTFEIRYSYEWKRSIPTSQRNTSKHPSRPFCVAVMNADKFYTRQDIETMSARLGYSVWDRRGGWWTMPDGEHSPSCRHTWVSNIVMKKKK